MRLRRFRQTPLAVFLKYEHFLAMQEKILKSEEERDRYFPSVDSRTIRSAF